MCASRSCFGALLIGALFSPGPGNAVEISGSIGAEVRGFSSAAQYPGQEDHLASIFAQPEFYFVSPDERRSFLFSPFLRVDAADSARTHFDVREAVFEYVGGNWEVRAGLAKVFWGVAESRHLVDVINQTDLVENLDGEAKLGQPLLSGSVIRDWGTVDLFLLPYFRTRTFPGTKGRLRSQFVVDDDTVRFDRDGPH